MFAPCWDLENPGKFLGQHLVHRLVQPGEISFFLRQLLYAVHALILIALVGEMHFRMPHDFRRRR